jgi:hypothetical protein
MQALDAVRAWRSVASGLSVNWSGSPVSWRDHISGRGYVDEERLVQPVAFPRFARELLGFDVGLTLDLTARAKVAYHHGHAITRSRVLAGARR